MPLCCQCYVDEATHSYDCSCSARTAVRRRRGVIHGAKRARAKRCAHLQAVCLPTRRGASSHWKCHAGAPMLIGGTCVDCEPLPAAQERRSTQCQARRRTLCVVRRRHEERRRRETGVRAAMHVAMRFWALPSSQCPGRPRVNSTNTHLGTQRATLALLTFGQDPRRSSRRQESRFKVPARLANAHHKTSARGRCVRRGYRRP